MARVLVEVCVDTAEGLAEAVAGGAGRIELCAALEVGGLTPSAGLMSLAAGCGLPVHAMIRPRAGGFVFGPGDVAVMCADIAAARAAGLAGVVLGALRPDGRLDEPLLRNLVAAAQGMTLTLHRAFDLVPDRAEAIEVALRLGFTRILTSGGAETAVLGYQGLADSLVLAAGRIGILPGAGVSAETVGALRGLGVTEVHGSCSIPGPAAPLGFGAPRRTSAERVRALVDAVAGWEGHGDAQFS